MPVDAPFPALETLMRLIGQAGRRLAEIDASEGAAGNVSVYVAWPIEPRTVFPQVETIALPHPAPALAGGGLLVSGSGRRLREILDDPTANLGFVQVDPGGTTGRLYTSERRLFRNLTSEFNSHLAVHQDQAERTGTNFHALIHAQPLHLTYLSHIPEYQDTLALSRRVLRWEPECIVHLPQGIGFIPYLIPGSAALMQANVEMLRRYRVVVWARHGVMARSDQSVKRACDRIEYAETGARYEYLNLVNHERASGLSAEEIRALCAAFGVEQEVF
ncbi:MAG: class II aldolase/adducin family protein [Chloroherpetonaceae bacterium]|nr:class II aldolase/adducin family protein [Chthonomonadaceae bacterium]MDW8207693.1 class II aldolase/adducin family protein [Chloroherpetonaceae bacterium]